MRRIRHFGWLPRVVGVGALLGVPMEAQAEVGVKLLSQSALLTDGQSGESYVRFSAADPAKFLLTGPGRVQADFRVNLAARNPPAAGDAVIVSILAEGRSVGSFRVQPKEGADSWKGETTIRPSASVGFYVDVEAGSPAYEFRVNGGPAGGCALLLVSAEKAKKPLAANAPVIPPRPPSAAAASVAPAAVATPAPTAVSSLPVSTRSTPHTVPATGAGGLLTLRKVSALSVGITLANDPSTTPELAPHLGYRLWVTERLGARTRASLTTRSGKTTVSFSPSGAPGSGSREASGSGYDADLSLGTFWNASRSETSALYAHLSAGPAFHKDLRRKPETGFRGEAGLGLELVPASFRSVGLTVEGGLRLSSFPSEELGTTVDPVLNVAFQYYLGR